MDSLIASAARALAAGDPISAVKPIALRDDTPARALRELGLRLCLLSGSPFHRMSDLDGREPAGGGPRDLCPESTTTVIRWQSGERPDSTQSSHSDTNTAT